MRRRTGDSGTHGGRFDSSLHVSEGSGLDRQQLADMAGNDAHKEKDRRPTDWKARMAARRRHDAKVKQLAEVEARLEEDEQELDDDEKEMLAEWKEMLEWRRNELRRRWRTVMRHRVMRATMRRQAAAAEQVAVPDPGPSMPVID